MRMAACSSGRRSARRFSKTPNIQTMSDQRLPTNHCQTDSSKARDVLGPETSYLCDAELDDETIGKALSSPVFIQERNQRTEDKLITLMKKVCCQRSPFSHSADKNQVAKWKTKQSGFSLKDKKRANSR